LKLGFISTLSSRYLRNGLTPDEGTRSAPALLGLLPSENGRARKGWGRRVPATAVIPAPRVVVTIIGLKAPVAGLVCPRWNPAANCRACLGYYQARDRERAAVRMG